MQPQEFGRVPVEVEDTQNQERRNTFVTSRLAELALLDHDELDFESELSAAA